MMIKKGKEDIDYIVCGLCYKKLRKITNIHLDKHDTNINEYKKMFPNKRTEVKILSDYRKRNIKGKIYEDILFNEKAKELKKKRVESTTQYNFEKRYCEICGKEFIAKESDTKRYCSYKCSFKSLEKGNKIIGCLNCNKQMIIRKNSNKKFCSHKCADEYRSKISRIDLTCSVCGKLIENIKQSEINKNIFCSKECSKIYKLNKSKYDYRTKAYLYYGKVCNRCNTDKNLLVHHKDGNRLNNNMNNLIILCKKCHSKLHREIDRYNNRFVGQANIEEGMVQMLMGLHKRFNLDISDKNFKDTPKRVARAYEEIFEGINAEKELENICDTSFPSSYDGMVVIKDVRVFSMCPHHFLPVEYIVNVGYMPDKKTVGLSKLARVVEILAKRPALQETFTRQISEILEKNLKPLGTIVQVKGRHFCMIMRGIKKHDSWTLTNSITGSFKKPDIREEFMMSIKNGGK